MSSPITIPVGANHFSGPLGALAALTLQPFIDGELPHLCERTLPRIAPIAELLPPGAVVLRSIDDRELHICVVEGDGWRARLQSHRADRDGWVEVFAITPELAEAVAADVASRCPRPVVSDAVDVTMWHRRDRAPTGRKRPVHASPWCETARNYPLVVRAALDRLVHFTPRDQDGRVVILHGEPGTGKTTAIRTLLWEWRSWSSAHLVLDGDTFVHDAGYVAEVTTQPAGKDRWVVVVIEDAGDLVDYEHPFGGDLSTILNISDGIVGMGTKALFVLTTNEPVRAVHPALTRAGRCLANIEFVPFSRREAIEWLRTDRGVPADGLTLAQLYERSGSIPQITNIVEPERHGVYL